VASRSQRSVPLLIFGCKKVNVSLLRVAQHAEAKVEIFPFTRYGALLGTMSFVSKDAVPDEKPGLFHQARVKL
jgi:hemolysin D